jgi:hypothetical protein
MRITKFKTWYENNLARHCEDLDWSGDEAISVTEKEIASPLVVVPSGRDFLILNPALFGHIPLLPLEGSL